MRKIYSFKKYESLTEGEMSDFVKKFSKGLDSLGDIKEKAKNEAAKCFLDGNFYDSSKNKCISDDKEIDQRIEELKKSDSESDKELKTKMTGYKVCKTQGGVFDHSSNMCYDGEDSIVDIAKLAKNSHKKAIEWIKKNWNFDQSKGNEFRKWMSEKHSDFKDSKGEKLDYKEGENLSFKNDTIKEAYIKHGFDWEESKSKEK